MNYRAYITRCLFLLLVVTILYSCNRPQTKLRLVFPNKVNYESLILAKDLGFFNESENSLLIRTVTSGIDAAEALNTGNADIIATGNGPAAIILSLDKNATILTRYATGERMHRLISDTAIHSISELKGKRIGVQKGSSTHVSLLTWLKNNHIPVESINLVPMQPSNMPEAVKNGQLDAIAGSEPWALNVKKLCGKSVYEMSDLYDSLNCQSHVIITKRSFIHSHKNQLNAIISGLKKANEYLHSNSDQCAGIVSKYTGLTSEEQQICTSRLNWALGWQQADIKSLESTANTLYELNYIKSIPQIEEHIFETELYENQ